jgi:hypothetical protein
LFRPPCDPACLLDRTRKNHETAREMLGHF